MWSRTEHKGGESGDRQGVSSVGLSDQTMLGQGGGSFVSLCGRRTAPTPLWTPSKGLLHINPAMTQGELEGSSAKHCGGDATGQSESHGPIWSLLVIQDTQ